MVSNIVSIGVSGFGGNISRDMTGLFLKNSFIFIAALLLFIKKTIFKGCFQIKKAA